MTDSSEALAGKMRAHHKRLLDIMGTITPPVGEDEMITDICARLPADHPFILMQDDLYSCHECGYSDFFNEILFDPKHLTSHCAQCDSIKLSIVERAVP